MINFIICDDNRKVVENIKNIISSYMMKNKLEYKTHLFYDYDSKFMHIVEANIPFKVYIMDIETPSKSGIDVARIIRNKDINSIIIFITGHEELGGTLLKNEIMFLSFINKFDDYENRLINSIKKALKFLERKMILRFEERGIIYTISLDDIIYITRDSVERKCIINTDYAEIKTYKSLSEIADLLDDRFVKSHRACIINKDRVVKIDKTNKHILFDNGSSINLLSSKYKKEVV